MAQSPIDIGAGALLLDMVAPAVRFKHRDKTLYRRGSLLDLGGGGHGARRGGWVYHLYSYPGRRLVLDSSDPDTEVVSEPLRLTV